MHESSEIQLATVLASYARSKGRVCRGLGGLPNVYILKPIGRLVPSQKLSPDVLVMESAEDRDRCNAAELLGSPKIWRIFSQ
jgi:hypothetical protein